MTRAPSSGDDEPRRRPPSHLTPQETARKAIHIAAALVATAITWRTSHPFAATLLTGTALLALGTDLARLYCGPIRRLFYRIFGFMLRPGEAHRLTGATMLAAGFAVAILLFPSYFAAAGFLYAGVGDAAAALIGRRFGRHRTAWGKSLEGSLAFFVMALLAGWAAPVIGFVPAALAALATTLLEASPLPIGDNLYLPVAGAAATWAAVTLVG